MGRLLSGGPFHNTDKFHRVGKVAAMLLEKTFALSPVGASDDTNQTVIDLQQRKGRNSMEKTKEKRKEKHQRKHSICDLLIIDGHFFLRKFHLREKHFVRIRKFDPFDENILSVFNHW